MDKVKIEPFKIIGIAIRTTNENKRATREIGELWGRFMAQNILEGIPNKVDATVYSLYTDYESDHTKPYTAILGCKVENLNVVPQGLVGRSFEGGNYVTATAKGDLSQGLIVKEWSKIWEMDLERRYTVDFEVFGPMAKNPKAAEVDFFVAVK